MSHLFHDLAFPKQKFYKDLPTGETSILPANEGFLGSMQFGNNNFLPATVLIKDAALNILLKVGVPIFSSYYIPGIHLNNGLVIEIDSTPATLTMFEALPSNGDKDPDGDGVWTV